MNNKLNKSGDYYERFYINEYNSVNNENINLKFKIISKKSEIISFKPCYIGRLRMIINGEEAINNSYSLPIFSFP